MRSRIEFPIEGLEVSAYRIPTDGLEADGTQKWDSTVLVLVEVTCAGFRGLGFTYASAAAGRLIQDVLENAISGTDALSVSSQWMAMVGLVRNQGLSGIAAMGISAVDNALWDLKAKILGQPLAFLLGTVRPGIDVYGSGGFTSYSETRLQEQLREWVAQSIPRVKMKVGSHHDKDPARVCAARQAIGSAELFVDANGAYTRKQALEMALRFADQDVRWFEEPLPVQDVQGNSWLRDRVPAGMDVSGGEYGYGLSDFRRLLEGGALDVLQADVTRCLGITGFLKVAALCEAYSLPLSSHCSPSQHLPLGCALGSMRHMEYFYDHVRIEKMLFDGFKIPVAGKMFPDPSRPGFGLEFKKADALPYAIPI